MTKNEDTNALKAYKYFGEIYNNVVDNNKKIYKDGIKNVIKSIKENKDFTFNFKNPKQLFKAFDIAIKSKKNFTYGVGDREWVLNPRSFNAFKEQYNGVEDDYAGSDIDAYNTIILQNSITFKYFSKAYKGQKKHTGGFFPYTNNFDYDLSPYQIMKEFNADGVVNNCFMQALINSKIVPELIGEIGLMILGRDVPQRCLVEIAEKFNIRICVKRPDIDHITTYNKESDKVLNLGLIDEHYFLNEKTDITRYAVEHYEDIKFVKDWRRIYRSGNKRCYDRFISSYDLILLLKELGQFKPLEITEELLKTIYYDKVDNIETLTDCNDGNTKPNVYNDLSGKDEQYINVFFDFETSTVGGEKNSKKKIDVGKKHKPYMCCIKNNELKKTFYGEYAGEEMLKFLAGKYKHIRLIAHNAGYDFRFLYKHLSNIKMIDRGKMILRANAVYFHYGKKIQIIIQDSYAIISSPLRSFGKMFNLKIEKDYMPYHLYTDENVENKYIHVSKAISGGSSSANDMIKFKENCMKWDCISDEGNIDLIKYSKIYCEMDCDVLEAGYNSFRKSSLETFNIDINNYMSAGSIAEAFMQKENVYSGSSKIGGVARAFIQKSMVGGRCMISKNIKKHIKNRVADFDAVSLYPSAMKRIGDIGGYLKGRPKIITNLTYDFLKSVDGYFVEIKIKKIGKDRIFPLISKLGEVRDFSNDMVGEIIHIDKFALEDLIEFQEVEFDIIKGYYYDEGRDDKILNVISMLFKERLRYKEEKNPIQELFKLIMNSAYGKTLQKPFETKSIYTDKFSHSNTVSKNYKSIKTIIKLYNDTIDWKGEIKENYKIDLYKDINTDCNNCHIGIEILSMSKRIMNEVMTLAEDNNYNIYYQDTDSMHIDDESVIPLANKFREKYGRELIGKSMGQFHTDFSSEKLKGNLISKESIYLGKKCYVDVLTDETGEIDYHVRMKGINREAIDYFCNINNITILELYKQLYEGDKITFDLACGGSKCCFQFNNDYTIQSLLKFEREIHF